MTSTLWIAANLLALFGATLGGLLALVAIADLLALLRQRAALRAYLASERHPWGPR